MRFFNLDLHVSVIEDVRTHLEHLGHEIESHLMSGHNWALGRQRGSLGTGDPSRDGHVGYGPVNLATWEGCFYADNDTDAEAKIASTLREQCPELDSFDGFVATYPPAFALLYEKFKGHTIVDIPVRYDLFFVSRPEDFSAYNDYLVRGVDSGKLTVIANSMYDAKYYEYFTGQPALYISSTCDYVDRFAPKYTGSADYFLGFGEHVGCRAMQREVPGVRFVRDTLPDPYKHEMLSVARGIVWLPYTTSIMSFFEHYWLNIPLFVPTKRFLSELCADGLAMSQFSWYPAGTESSCLPRAGTDLPDPNVRDNQAAWMGTYDFYNAAEFPFVTYFDSWNELKESISTVDLRQVSQNMKTHNAVRRARNLGKWTKVMQRVQAWKDSAS